MAVFISLGLQAAGLLMITMTESPLQLALVIALFGFGGGAGLPMSNILFRITFTQKSFGTSRGLSQPFIFIFQAMGTPGVALLFQHYGNYDNAFLLLTGMVLLAMSVIWLMEKPQELVSSS